VAGVPCDDIIYENNNVVYCLTGEAMEPIQGPIIVETTYGFGQIILTTQNQRSWVSIRLQGQAMEEQK